MGYRRIIRQAYKLLPQQRGTIQDVCAKIRMLPVFPLLFKNAGAAADADAAAADADANAAADAAPGKAGKKKAAGKPLWVKSVEKSITKNQEFVFVGRSARDNKSVHQLVDSLIPA